MKLLSQRDHGYTLRFDRGEEVLAGLQEFVATENLGGAHFTAIGAAGEVVLAYYNLETKQYEDHDITENVEIASVIGNAAHMEGKIIIHAHGTFSRQDLSVVGGHIKKLVVSATCEVYLSLVPQRLERVRRKNRVESTNISHGSAQFERSFLYGDNASGAHGRIPREVVVIMFLCN